MQIEKENEESAMDSFLCLSFSTYSSNNLNDVAEQVINENDYSHSQNDNDDFEFVLLQKTADEVFFDNRLRNSNTTHGVSSISKYDDAAENSIPLRELIYRDVARKNSDAAEDSIPLKELINREDDRRNSDAVDTSIPFRKLITGDQKRNIDPPALSSLETEDDLDVVPPASYCLWKPKSPKVSPIATPINCKKSNLTGSTSNPSSSKRWKFLSLVRRSKSNVTESLILVTPSLEFKKEGKVENAKVKSSGKGNSEKNIAKVEEKIPVAERKIPAPVTAMQAFYLRKKENKRKSYLPYKQELIGFGVGFSSTIGRVFPLRKHLNHDSRKS